MSLTLISAKELRELLGDLEVHQIGGVAYVDARELAARVNVLIRGSEPTAAEVAESDAGLLGILDARLTERAAAAEAPIAAGAPNLLEQERARLEALPPGPCAACACPTTIAHPEGRCVECDCTPYVDATERDPIVTLAARGIVSAPTTADIAPAVSMFDVQNVGLDHREPMSNRFVG